MAGFEPAKFSCSQSRRGDLAPQHLDILAVATGLEPATSCVTGRHSNQLNYATVFLRTYPDSNQDLPPRTGTTLTTDDFRLIKLYVLLRLRWESNPRFRLPTCYRDRVVQQPLCAVTFCREGGNRTH